MEIQSFLNNARKSISKFCVEECHAYCCRKGYLVVSEKEARLIIKKKDFQQDINIKRLENGTYSLYMGGTDLPCPGLNKDFTCGLHDKRLRPMTCKNFPIFLIDSKTVKFSSRCLAVNTGMFYPYIVKLISQGYKIVKGDIDSDFYNICDCKEN